MKQDPWGSLLWWCECYDVQQAVILNGFFPSPVSEKHIYLFRSYKDEFKMIVNIGLPKGLDPSYTAWQCADVWKPPTYPCGLQYEVPRGIILTA